MIQEAEGKTKFYLLKSKRIKVHLAAQDYRKHMADCHLVLSGVTSENQEKNNWTDL